MANRPLLDMTERSIGELTTLASGWFDTIIRSAWSGGRALISILSPGVVTPIVAFYLVYDWDKMIATIDNWVPAAHQETFRALAREIDNTISGFVRGQSYLCLVLAIYYAVALRLIGLEHGILIGAATGWQQHSVRGSFAGVVRKRLGLNLVSEPGEGGRVYRIIDTPADRRKQAA